MKVYHQILGNIIVQSTAESFIFAENEGKKENLDENPKAISEKTADRYVVGREQY